LPLRTCSQEITVFSSISCFLSLPSEYSSQRFCIFCSNITITDGSSSKQIDGAMIIQ
jgi:hypothetical protein